jgi:hypothetical protein
MDFPQQNIGRGYGEWRAHGLLRITAHHKMTVFYRFFEFQALCTGGT